MQANDSVPDSVPANGTRPDQLAAADQTPDIAESVAESSSAAEEMPSLDQALPLEDLELALQLITQGFVSMAVREKNSRHMRSSV